MNKQQPQWQAINMLPVFSEVIAGMLESSLTQLNHMRRVLDKPHVLDDQTLNRMTKLVNEQLEDHWMFEAQFARWKQGPLSFAEERKIDRLIQLASKLKATNEAILKLIRCIEDKTMDKIKDMDDLELAQAMLAGELRLQ